MKYSTNLHQLFCCALLFLKNGAQATTYFVAPTGAKNARDSIEEGYGSSRESPFATAAYAAGLLNDAGAGGTVILLDGIYKNENFDDGDIWNMEHTIRLNDVHGTESSHIIIKGDTPTGHTIYGDASSIVQARMSTYITLEDLNIEGEVQNIPWQDAWDSRFLFKEDDWTNEIVREREDKDATVEEIEAKGDSYEDLSDKQIFRPTYFSTIGLLVQSCRYVKVKNCRVGYAPGTGLRVQSSDFVKVEGNTVHNSSRRSAIGNHGMVIHTVTNKVKGMKKVDYDGYRIEIIGNTVFDNYNEIYSWSSLKTFITPHIDEGKGITVQKTHSSFNSGTGRILIANNVVYSNGFSGVHTNFAKKVDIYHNTAVENSATGSGKNCGISVSDSADVKVANNIAIATNDFGCDAYGTDSDNQDAKQIYFTSNLAVGELSNNLPNENFFFSSVDDVNLDASKGYRIIGASSAAGKGDPSILDTVPVDKDNLSRSDPPDLGAYNADSDATPSPTLSPQPSIPLSSLPSGSPSLEPSPLPTRCTDNPGKFKSNNRKKITCDWVSRKRKLRCKKLNAPENCPVTCDALTNVCIGDSDAPSAAPSRCTDNPDEFQSGKKMRLCTWVAKNKTKRRCKMKNVMENCPVTCENENCL